MHQDNWQVSCPPMGSREAGTCAKRLQTGVRLDPREPDCQAGIPLCIDTKHWVGIGHSQAQSVSRQPDMLHLSTLSRCTLCSRPDTSESLTASVMRIGHLSLAATQKITHVWHWQLQNSLKVGYMQCRCFSPPHEYPLALEACPEDPQRPKRIPVCSNRQLFTHRSSLPRRGISNGSCLHN